MAGFGVYDSQKLCVRFFKSTTTTDFSESDAHTNEFNLYLK